MQVNSRSFTPLSSPSSTPSPGLLRHAGATVDAFTRSGSTAGAGSIDRGAPVAAIDPQVHPPRSQLVALLENAAHALDDSDPERPLAPPQAVMRRLVADMDRGGAPSITVWVKGDDMANPGFARAGAVDRLVPLRQALTRLAAIDEMSFVLRREGRRCILQTLAVLQANPGLERLDAALRGPRASHSGFVASSFSMERFRPQPAATTIGASDGPSQGPSQSASDGASQKRSASTASSRTGSPATPDAKHSRLDSGATTSTSRLHSPLQWASARQPPSVSAAAAAAAACLAKREPLREQLFLALTDQEQQDLVRTILRPFLMREPPATFAITFPPNNLNRPENNETCRNNTDAIGKLRFTTQGGLKKALRAVHTTFAVRRPVVFSNDSLSNSADRVSAAVEMRALSVKQRNILTSAGFKEPAADFRFGMPFSPAHGSPHKEERVRNTVAIHAFRPRNLSDNQFRQVLVDLNLDSENEPFARSPYLIRKAKRLAAGAAAPVAAEPAPATTAPTDPAPHDMNEASLS